MHVALIEQISLFRKVKVPLYIEVRLKETALKHLGLPDLGKLRDRMEGQMYLDNLKKDIFSEFAFEKIIGIRSFQWDKRDNKYYKRKNYVFDNKELSLIAFWGDKYPRISLSNVKNCIFVYVGAERNVFVSRLATFSILKNYSNRTDSNIIEITDFRNFLEYNSVTELISLLEA